MSDPSLFSGSPSPLLAIFTDFDGTLVELAETPDAIHVPTELAERLARAINEFDHAFAILTGREIADIDTYLGELHLPIAGAHGAQRRRADGSFEEVLEIYTKGASEIAQALALIVAENEGLILEEKDGAVALHYRQAPELEELCREAMTEVLTAHSIFTMVPGKMVFEARPAGFDKGNALRAFMQEAPFAGRTPIFIGDDVTDEDAFRAAQELGGIGIKLGPGDTAARMRIADVASVNALIEGLIDIASRSATAQTDTTPPETITH
ncbi:trehalose-phosphatase [Devosia sp. WQ 349]|uniref:trehalose-phosphatase n=1 Tax=Devosia sp. WQ 349K1 TaxID=2800329 RepID=UPI00190395BB|nr:trehalose-phosphatase [Devosia sp. WQ 349K1]MBK1794012.1 trehalose-phosphatase [Devosia sp. WQ 349K1]